MAKSKTEKAKKPRSEKQLANDERLRSKKAEVAAPVAPPVTPPEDDDFKPTEVVEKELAGKAKVDAGLDDGLKEPEIKEDAELTTVLPEDNQPTPVPQTAPVDQNLIAAVVAAVMQAQQSFPQAAQASPDQKFDELEAAAPQQRNRQHSARLGAGGEVQGVVFRYEVDKGYYPDPTARLLDESRLARFAMKENFIFRWSVDGVEYKKNNITYSEPRFTLELFRRLYNEEGEHTGRAALVARQIMHEDEFTTKIMAMRLGIIDQFEDTDEGFRALMNEIRYQRLQQWLFAIFTPPKITTFRKRPTTQVIDGKAVEVYDTETLTDHDTGVSAAATLQSQAGIGSVAVPE